MAKIPGVSSGDESTTPKSSGGILDTLFGSGRMLTVAIDKKDPVSVSIINIEKILDADVAIQKEQIKVLKDIAESISTGFSTLTGAIQTDGISLTLLMGGETLENMRALQLAATDKNVLLLSRFTNAVVLTIKTISEQSKFIAGYNSVIETIVNGSKKLGEVKPLDIAKAAAGFSAAVAMFGLTAILIGATVGFEAIAKTALMLGLFVGAAWLFSKIDSKKVLVAAVSIATLGLAIWGFSELVTPEMVIKTSLAVLALGVVLWGFSKLVNPVTVGLTAVGLAVLGLAVYGISLALGEFENLSWESIGKGLVAIGGLMAIMTLAGTASPLIIAGGAAVAVVAVGIGLLAGALYLIQNLEVTEKKIDDFKYATIGIGDALMSIGSPLQIPFILAGAATALAMGAGTLLMSAALAAVSAVSIPDKAQIDAFGYALTQMGAAYEQIGGPIITPMILLGTATAVAMSVATVLTSGAIAIFAKIANDPKSVETALLFLKTFIDGTTSIFTGHSIEEYATVAAGITAFAGIGSLISVIARSVANMASLRFDETEIVNGKLVVKSSRQLSVDDFKKVGNTIGMIISALTEPLSKIGSSEGFFSDSDVENGIEALSGIGNVLNPLAGIVTSFTQSKIDKKAVDAFNVNINSLIKGVSSAIIGAAELDDDKVENLFNTVVTLDKFISLVTNKDLDKGATSLDKIAKSTGSLKTVINEINLEKLTKFNDTLISLQKIEDNEGFAKLAEAIMELVEKIADIQQKTIETQQAQSTVTNNTQFVTLPEQKEITKEIITAIDTGNESLSIILQDLYELLAGGQTRVKVTSLPTP